jgi:hypothetical protein
MQTSKKKKKKKKKTPQGWKAKLNAPLPFPFSQKMSLFQWVDIVLT